MITPNTRRNVDKQLRKRNKKAPVGEGTIQGSVPGHKLLAYVCVPDHDLPLVLRDESTGRTKGQKVQIGRDQIGNRYQVLGAKLRGSESGGGLSSLPQHAPTHLLGGIDPVYIHSKQLLPLLVYPSGGFVVTCAQGDVQTNTGFKHLFSQSLDLTSSVPASGARWVLVQVDQTGALTSKAGTAVAVFQDLLYDHIPQTDAGCMPLAAVRLYAGQSAISASYQQPDVIDLRFSPLHTSVSSSTSSVWQIMLLDPSSGASQLYPATVAGLVAALTAATSGMIVMIPSGTFVTDISVPAGVDLIGQGPFATLIQGKATLAGDNNLVNLRIEATGSSASAMIAIDGPGAGQGASLTGCSVRASNSGTGNAIAMNSNGGWITARSTYFRAVASDVGAKARIVYGSAASDWAFEQCTFAAGVLLSDAVPANWALAETVTPTLYGCDWPTLWAPTGIAYGVGDRSPLNHNHKLDDLDAPDDNTDLNASSTKHGLLPKLSNNAGEYLNGTGGWSAPTVITDHGALTGLADDDHLQYITNTPASTARNVIQPSGDYVPLTLKGGGTTANLLNLRNSSDTLLSLVSSAGWIGVCGPANQQVDITGNLRFTPITAPTAPSAALAGAGAGSVTNGDHKYRVTYVTATGETELGTASGTVTVADNTTDGKINVTIPTSSQLGVTARKLYRTKAGDATTMYLLATINDNTTTSYLDNTADASLGASGTYRGNTTNRIYRGTGISGIIGTGDTALGFGALMSLTSGYQNTALGANALSQCTTGFQNMSVGDNSLPLLTTGWGNMAIGSAALRSVVSGRRNCAIGFGALFNATVDDNVGIGYQAGYNITTGSANITIGYQAGYRQTTASNLLIIDNRDRSSAANELAHSLIYGVMAASSGSQSLRLNALVTISPEDAATSTVMTELTLGHNSTATPAAGFGGRVLMQLESSTTADQDAAAIAWSWSTATHASRTGALKLQTVDNAGALATMIELDGSKLGFYGVTTVAKPTTSQAAATFTQNSGTAVNDASTFDGYTIGQVVAALRSLGLLA